MLEGEERVREGARGGCFIACGNTHTMVSCGLLWCVDDDDGARAMLFAACRFELNL